MRTLKKLSICILSGLLCFGIGASTQAAEKVGNGVYELSTFSPESGVETDSISSIDITGDGKKDKIETNITTSKVTLKVNNKIVGRYPTDNSNIRIVNLSKKAFFEITTYGKNNTINCGLYEVKKNKLSRVFDYKKLINLKQCNNNNFGNNNGLWTCFEAAKVKGNTLYLRGHFGTKNLGQINAGFLPLSYSGKNFTVKSSTLSANAGYIPVEGFTNSFTAAQKIQTYKEAGSSKKAFTISKKAKFAVKKLAIIKKNLYIQVSCGKKTGWINLNTSNKKIVKNTAFSISG